MGKTACGRFCAGPSLAGTLPADLRSAKFAPANLSDIGFVSRRKRRGSIRICCSQLTSRALRSKAGSRTFAACAAADLSGNVVEIDRLADALERPIRIEPGVVGRIPRARQRRHRDPASHRLLGRQDMKWRQRLAREVRGAAVRQVELSDLQLRCTMLEAQEI